MRTIEDAVRSRFGKSSRTGRELRSVDTVGIGFSARSSSDTVYRVAAGDSTALKVLRSPGEESAVQDTLEIECDAVVTVTLADGTQTLMALRESYGHGYSVELSTTRITPIPTATAA